MIQANELRIGNWFLGGWRDAMQPMQVDADHLSIWFGHTNMAQFPPPKPIPITPDILIACGFEETKVDGNSAKFEVYTLSPFTYNTNHGWWLYGRKMEHQPQSIHQLQNLYYALTGTELTYSP